MPGGFVGQIKSGSLMSARAIATRCCSPRKAHKACGLHPLLEAYTVEQFASTSFGRGAGSARHACRQADVLSASNSVTIIRLENEPHFFVAQSRQLATGKPARFRPASADLTTVRRNPARPVNGAVCFCPHQTRRVRPGILRGAIPRPTPGKTSSERCRGGKFCLTVFPRSNTSAHNAMPLTGLSRPARQAGINPPRMHTSQEAAQISRIFAKQLTPADR